MKEHPLLMKGPLVRATLEGRKTQTRRPIKQEAQPDLGFEWSECLCREIDPSDTPCVTCSVRFPGIPEAGDRLWVRETWAIEDCPTDEDRIIWKADRAAAWASAMDDVFYLPSEYEPAGGWKGSIHMPRWACRLVLPLVSVRVERVQDITEEDAKAEGVEPIGRSYREGFRAVWQNIYGTWDLNPWVWVAEWKEIEVSR